MPTGEHEASIVSHKRFSVGMEVTEHSVAAPATNDTDFIGVDAGEEESHGSTSAKGTGGNLIRMDASMAWDCEGSSAKEAGDHGGGHGSSSAVVFVVNMKWSGDGGFMAFEMRHTS